MPRKKTVRTIEEIRKRKKEAEQRRRYRIKANPVKKEEYKAKEKLRRQKRKQLKKDVSIADMSERGQRIQRKKWRESSQRYRENKKAKETFIRRLRDDSPPSTDIEDHVEIDRQETQSPSIITSVYLDIPLSSPHPPQSPISASSAASPTCSTCRSGESRQKTSGLKRSKHTKTLKNKIIKQQKEKIDILKKKIHALSQKIYRQKNEESVKVVRSPAGLATRMLTPRQLRFQTDKMEVQSFLEKDENSKLCPGKKDTITRSGKKKQKRYLSDSLENLHKKFNLETGKTISYATFTRFRPFWIVQQKVTNRDTCACTLHENVNMMISRLYQLDLIREKSAVDVIDAIICDRNDYKCMTKKCDECSNKTLEIKEYENSDTTCNQWCNIIEKRMIKGKETGINRIVKKPVECTKEELLEKLFQLLPKFLIHELTISKQYKAVRQIKSKLTDGEVLLHIDFSENYQCKYSNEVQSVHFGASRQQICLHTCVLYYKHEDLGVIPLFFCSVSDCLRHDAAAIYAHLRKSLREVIREHNIKIDILHILSDGPSGQYKNKSNFYLFSQHLARDFDLIQATWNFSAAGHGKGPVDGIGATIKRTADALVAQGQDIPDFKTFVVRIAVRTNVYLVVVTESDVKQAEAHIPKDLTTIQQTKKIHQVTWTFEKPQCIFLRELSCMECDFNSVCSHFPIDRGFFQYPEILTDDHLMPLTLDSGDIQTNKDTTDNQEYRKEEDSLEHNETNEHKLIEDNEASPSGFCHKKSSQIVLMSGFMKMIGSWIVVEYEGKKHPAHFVGQVMSIQKDEQAHSYVVKFLRKKNLAAGIFVWQEPEDISLVLDSDIVLSLPEPTPTRRGELQFDFDFIDTQYFFK